MTTYYLPKELSDYVDEHGGKEFLAGLVIRDRDDDCELDAVLHPKDPPPQDPQRTYRQPGDYLGDPRTR